MLKNKAKIAPDSTRVPSRALKRALDPGRKDFALRAHDARSAHKNTFFYLKIWFFKLNNIFFESDRLAALRKGSKKLLGIKNSNSFFLTPSILYFLQHLVKNHASNCLYNSSFIIKNDVLHTTSTEDLHASLVCLQVELK